MIILGIYERIFRLLETKIIEKKEVLKKIKKEELDFSNYIKDIDLYEVNLLRTSLSHKMAAMANDYINYKIWKKSQEKIMNQHQIMIQEQITNPNYMNQNINQEKIMNQNMNQQQITNPNENDGNFNNKK